MLQDYLLSNVSPFSPPRNSFSTSALQMVNPKSSLITIGWMRNWFHSWMSRSWIGNYDILLTTSSISKQFFENFQGAFPVLCYRHCPSPLQLIQQRRSITGNLLISSIYLITFNLFSQDPSYRNESNEIYIEGILFFICIHPTSLRLYLHGKLLESPTGDYGI